MIIGTRASPLALWQANHVKDLIESRFNIPVTLEKISTKGDEILDRSLIEIGGKGLFLKEIEEQLQAGTIDIAVHSMKDVPYELPRGLVIGAILEREDPTDALVSNKFSSLENLPNGARIGTSSLRRLVQLQKRFPHFQFEPLRGNVGTRLKKLDDGQFDAIVLASAGLKRLGLESRITQRLNLVSAVGQGAVGIECRKDLTETKVLVEKLSHAMTSRAVVLERYFSQKVGGSCQLPVGCFVETDAKDENCFTMRCFLADPDGGNYFEKNARGTWDEGRKIIDEILA